MRRGEYTGKIDWITVGLITLLVFLGWLNIYAAVYDEQSGMNIFNTSLNSGRQLIWICLALVIAATVFILDFKFYDSFAYIIYGVTIFLLILVLFLGKEVSGSKSWLGFGGFYLQPSEFAKFAVALALAKFLGEGNVRLTKWKPQVVAFGFLLIPMLLTVLQGDTGTALVYAAFIIVLYREGLSPRYLILGLSAIFLFVVTILVNDQIILMIAIVVLTLLTIALSKRNVKTILTVCLWAVMVAGFVTSVDFFINNVLKPHQQKRVMALFNPDADPQGSGWNVIQSKIAIGSGGVWGKGYLQGTQTKLDYVPEQSTDFIFSTIGEEHGWIGSTLLIVLFVALMYRIIFLAERQKSRFARVYGYGVVAVVFFHFMVNIGMTIGLFPVIGIPLPFFSYGGSSLWSFTILLFVMLKLDSHRMQILVR